VILEMAQSDQHGAKVTFLPERCDVRRCDQDDSQLLVAMAGHPLLRRGLGQRGCSLQQENAKHIGAPCDFVSVDPICELQPQAPRRPILRRDPSSSILHRILERHAPAFWAACEQRGRHYPPFLQRQLSSFARCGDPAHGFARIYCPHCRREEFLAFSCKVRQLCPCCCARRMNAQAAHLVDHVLPTVPLRQWVLTVPFEIRALLAFDPKLLSLLRRIYVQETLRFFEAQIASTGVHQPRGGAVNFAHRVDGALRINPHFHTLVLDGAYDNAPRPQFHELSQLSLSDLESILSRIIARSPTNAEPTLQVP
jgi:hypothetical protein